MHTMVHRAITIKFIGLGPFANGQEGVVVRISVL
jgi:hypothetical protein